MSTGGDYYTGGSATSGGGSGDTGTDKASILPLFHSESLSRGACGGGTPKATRVQDIALVKVKSRQSYCLRVSLGRIIMLLGAVSILYVLCAAYFLGLWETRMAIVDIRGIEVVNAGIERAAGDGEFQLRGGRSERGEEGMGNMVMNKDLVENNNRILDDSEGEAQEELEEKTTVGVGKGGGFYFKDGSIRRYLKKQMERASAFGSGMKARKEDDFNGEDKSGSRGLDQQLNSQPESVMNLEAEEQGLSPVTWTLVAIPDYDGFSSFPSSPSSRGDGNSPEDSEKLGAESGGRDAMPGKRAFKSHLAALRSWLWLCGGDARTNRECLPPEIVICDSGRNLASLKRLVEAAVGPFIGSWSTKRNGTLSTFGGRISIVRMPTNRFGIIKRESVFQYAAALSTDAAVIMEADTIVLPEFGSILHTIAGLELLKTKATNIVPEFARFLAIGRRVEIPLLNIPTELSVAHQSKMKGKGDGAGSGAADLPWVTELRKNAFHMGTINVHKGGDVFLFRTVHSILKLMGCKDAGVHGMGTASSLAQRAPLGVRFPSFVVSDHHHSHLQSNEKMQGRTETGLSGKDLFYEWVTLMAVRLAQLSEKAPKRTNSPKIGACTTLPHLKVVDISEAAVLLHPAQRLSNFVQQNSLRTDIKLKERAVTKSVEAYNSYLAFLFPGIFFESMLTPAPFLELDRVKSFGAGISSNSSEDSSWRNHLPSKALFDLGINGVSDPRVLKRKEQSGSNEKSGSESEAIDYNNTRNVREGVYQDARVSRGFPQSAPYGISQRCTASGSTANFCIVQRSTESLFSRVTNRGVSSTEEKQQLHLLGMMPPLEETKSSKDLESSIFTNERILANGISVKSFNDAVGMGKVNLGLSLSFMEKVMQFQSQSLNTFKHLWQSEMAISELIRQQASQFVNRINQGDSKELAPNDDKIRINTNPLVILLAFRHFEFELLLNFICRLQDLALDNFVIAALDMEAFHMCRQMLLPCFPQFEVEDGPPNDHHRVRGIRKDIGEGAKKRRKYLSVLAKSADVFTLGEQAYAAQLEKLHSKVKEQLNRNSDESVLETITKSTFPEWGILTPLPLPGKHKKQEGKKSPMETGGKSSSTLGDGADENDELTSSDLAEESFSDTEEKELADGSKNTQSPFEELEPHRKSVEVMNSIVRILEAVEAHTRVMYFDISTTFMMKNGRLLVPLMESLPYDVIGLVKQPASGDEIQRLKNVQSEEISEFAKAEVELLEEQHSRSMLNDQDEQKMLAKGDKNFYFLKTTQSGMKGETYVTKPVWFDYDRLISKNSSSTFPGIPRRGKVKPLISPVHSKSGTKARRPSSDSDAFHLQEGFLYIKQNTDVIRGLKRIRMGVLNAYEEAIEQLLTLTENRPGFDQTSWKENESNAGHPSWDEITANGEDMIPTHFYETMCGSRGQYVSMTAVGGTNVNGEVTGSGRTGSSSLHYRCSSDELNVHFLALNKKDIFGSVDVQFEPSFSLAKSVNPTGRSVPVLAHSFATRIPMSFGSFLQPSVGLSSVYEIPSLASDKLESKRMDKEFKTIRDNPDRQTGSVVNRGVDSNLARKVRSRKDPWVSLFSLLYKEQPLGQQTGGVHTDSNLHTTHFSDQGTTLAHVSSPMLLRVSLRGISHVQKTLAFTHSSKVSSESNKSSSKHDGCPDIGRVRVQLLKDTMKSWGHWADGPSCLPECVGDLLQ
eukprot:Nk52_evm7s214 gene=Nk52_evmTU7s214